MLIYSPCHRVPPMYLALEGALHDVYTMFVKFRLVRNLNLVAFVLECEYLEPLFH